MAEGSVKTHDLIRFKNPDFGRDTIYGYKAVRVIETTAGRVLFNQIWPKDIGFFNRAAGKKQLSKIIWLCYQVGGQEETFEPLKKLKELASAEATKAGVSIEIW